MRSWGLGCALIGAGLLPACGSDDAGGGDARDGSISDARSDHDAAKDAAGLPDAAADASDASADSGDAGASSELRLRVSSDGHRLETKDGTPFFFLSDTEWLLNRHSDDQVVQILDDRRAKEFTVVQVFASRNWENGTSPACTDVNGNYPFVDNDVSQLNTPYWERWRWIADRAQERGLHLLLIYGEPGRKESPWACNTLDECYAYARLVGDRFKDKPGVIFCDGQDSDAASGVGPDGWRAMAEGVADGINGVDSRDGTADYSTSTITYHGYSIYQTFQLDDLIDFYGQEVWLDNSVVYSTISAAYALTNPTKPIALLEGAYENEVDFITPHYVRVEAWHTYFAGGMGYGYGHYDNWFQSDSVDYLGSPGAEQMAILAAFMNSRPWWKLVPDQSILSAGESSGSSRKVALRASDGTGCSVYYPVNESAEIRMSCITSSSSVTAAWLDPRNGDTQPAGSFGTSDVATLQPPGGWEDAVLVLDPK